MYKISSIISEIYNKYLPLAEQKHIRFDLDLGKNNDATDSLDEVKQNIETCLKYMMQKAQSQITICVKSHHVVILSDAIMPRDKCQELNNNQIQAKSRIGFGTTINISF